MLRPSATPFTEQKKSLYCMLSYVPTEKNIAQKETERECKPRTKKKMKNFLVRKPSIKNLDTVSPNHTMHMYKDKNLSIYTL